MAKKSTADQPDQAPKDEPKPDETAKAEPAGAGDPGDEAVEATLAIADAMKPAGAVERADPRTPGWAGLAAELASRIGGTIAFPKGYDKEGRPLVEHVDLRANHILAAAKRGNMVSVLLADGRKVEVTA